MHKRHESSLYDCFYWYLLRCVYRSSEGASKDIDNADEGGRIPFDGHGAIHLIIPVARAWQVQAAIGFLHDDAVGYEFEVLVHVGDRFQNLHILYHLHHRRCGWSKAVPRLHCSSSSRGVLRSPGWPPSGRRIECCWRRSRWLLSSLTKKKLKYYLLSIFVTSRSNCLIRGCSYYHNLPHFLFSFILDLSQHNHPFINGSLALWKKI